MAKKEKSKEKKVKASKQSNKGNNNFIKATKAELKKVIWPNLKQLSNNTLAVISVVIIVGVIVFLLDVCFDKINSFGIDKIKEVVQTENAIESVEETESEDTESEVSEEIVEGTESEEETTTETETQE